MDRLCEVAMTSLQERLVHDRRSLLVRERGEGGVEGEGGSKLCFGEVCVVGVGVVIEGVEKWCGGRVACGGVRVVWGRVRVVWRRVRVVWRRVRVIGWQASLQQGAWGGGAVDNLLAHLQSRGQWTTDRHLVRLG